MSNSSFWHWCVVCRIGWLKCEDTKLIMQSNNLFAWHTACRKHLVLMLISSLVSHCCWKSANMVASVTVILTARPQLMSQVFSVVPFRTAGEPSHHLHLNFRGSFWWSSLCGDERCRLWGWSLVSDCGNMEFPSIADCYLDFSLHFHLLHGRQAFFYHHITPNKFSLIVQQLA